MTLKKIPFDIVSELDSDEVIAEYLAQVFADGDADEIIRALGYVAKARGMAMVAKESGLGRESLYKALTPGAQPRFDTVLRVCRAIGMPLQSMPVAAHLSA
jgi:probable addiction module antidote protein